MHGSTSQKGEIWLIALPGGRRVNVKMSNIKPAGDLDAEVVNRRGSTDRAGSSTEQSHD